MIQMSNPPMIMADPTPQASPSHVLGDRPAAIFVRPICRPKKYS